MQTALWTIASFIAYAGGLVILWKITPRLLTQSITEGLFMAMAALDILGGLLVFGSIVVALSVNLASIGIKIVCFFLLIGVFWIALRQAVFCWRRRGNTAQVSRILVISYCVFLAGAAVFTSLQLLR